MNYTQIYSSPDYAGTYVSTANQCWYKLSCNGTGRYVITWAKQIGFSKISSTWLFFSNDGADTWSRAVNTTSQLNWTDVCFSFTGQFIFAITRTTCYRSPDYGVTWTETLTGTNMVSVCCNIEGNMVYIATTGTGVYKSANYGGSFSFLANVVVAADWRHQGCTSLDGKYVYFSGDNSSSSAGGLIASSNYGTTWATVLTGPYNSVCCDITGQKVAVTKGKNTNSPLFISTDYGVTFTQTLSPATSSVFARLDFSSIFVVDNTSNPKKISSSIDMGATWSDVISVTTTSNIYINGGSSMADTIYFTHGLEDDELFVYVARRSSYDIPSITGTQTGAMVASSHFNFTETIGDSNYSTYSSFYGNLLYKNLNEPLKYLLKPPGIVGTPASYYLWCGNLDYKVNGIDLGRYICPKYTIYASDTSGTTRSDCVGIFVMLIGGGGGGGGGAVQGDSDGGGSGGSGGGGGGVGAVYIENPSPGTAMSFTYAIGAGGAGGEQLGSSSNIANGNLGTAGGNTTFTYGGTTYTAYGGGAGQYGFGAGNIGGGYYGLPAGGTTTNLTYSFNGNGGLIGSDTRSSTSVGKAGGEGGKNGNFTGNVSTSYALINDSIISVINIGAGGAGGRGDSSASGDKGEGGTAGTSGAVIVFEHYSWKYPDIPNVTGTPGTDYSVVFGSEGALISVYTTQTVKLKSNWEMPLNIAIVGGGGSGGSSYLWPSGTTFADSYGVTNTRPISGGGGGGGGSVTTTSIIPLADTYNVTVGAGGASVGGVTTTSGNNGGTTSFIGSTTTTNLSANGGNGAYWQYEGSIIVGKPGSSTSGSGGRGGQDYALITDSASWPQPGGDGDIVSIPTIYTGNTTTDFYFGGGGGGGCRGMQSVALSSNTLWQTYKNYVANTANIPVANRGYGGGGGGGGNIYKNGYGTINVNGIYYFPDGRTTYTSERTVNLDGVEIVASTTDTTWNHPQNNGVLNSGGGGGGAIGAKNSTQTTFPGADLGQVSGKGGTGICLLWFSTDYLLLGGSTAFSYSNNQYQNDCLIVTGSGTLKLDGNFAHPVDIWLVGGGGGGGGGGVVGVGGGGGGGGGITILKNYSWVKNKTYTFTIGSGGTAGTSGDGGNGSSTIFLDGGTTLGSAPGGSGGTGATFVTIGVGGAAGTRISNYSSSGNGAYGSYTNNIGDDGASSIGYANGSGTKLTYYYFGGGGAGGGILSSGKGGLGGGGGGNSMTNGGISYVYSQNLITAYSPTATLNGVPNSGGGGAGGSNGSSGGSGGSGVAIIWFKTGTVQDWSQKVPPLTIPTSIAIPRPISAITGANGTDWTPIMSSNNYLYTIYTSQTITFGQNTTSASFLLVGGGGSGSGNGLQNTNIVGNGWHYGGGGGTGGAIITGTITGLPGDTFSIVIGNGGVSVQPTDLNKTVNGNPGSSSTIAKNGNVIYTSPGGLGGRMDYNSPFNGMAGIITVGYDGYGNGGAGDWNEYISQTPSAIIGGTGKSTTIFGTTYYFGGGGSGGSCWGGIAVYKGGLGGGGGGGNGNLSNTGLTYTFPDGKQISLHSKNGMANTGGGGAGANSNSTQQPIASGSGGSGICILWFTV